MRDEACGNCRFWKAGTGEDEGYGHCRRIPPVRDQAADVAHALGIYAEGPYLMEPKGPNPFLMSTADRLYNFDGLSIPAVYPLTPEDEWCGEYRPADAATGQPAAAE